MPRTRSVGLALGLAFTLAAVWYAAGLEETTDTAGADADLLADPAPRAPSPAVPLPVPAPPPEATPSDTAPRMTPPQGKLFAAHSWQPPAPPPPVAAPAPAPRAPALPYRYLGRMEEDGQVVVFLAEGADPRPRLVRQGDQWASYRVDAITPQELRMTYLPLNETQRLLFGNAN